MDLSATQQRVVDHGAGLLRVAGRAGTGKTTALAARWVKLAEATDPSRMLVLCRSRDTAALFRQTLLPNLRGGFDALPVATFGGLAWDLLARRSDAEPPRLLTGPRQRAAVRRLLAGEGAGEWPTLQGWLRRPAFADEVAGALLAARGAGLADEEILSRAEAAGVRPRWEELLAFSRRYERALHAEGAVDRPGLLARAGLLLADAPSPYEHVLVDDYEAATRPDDDLLHRLLPSAESVAVAADPGDSRARFFTALPADTEAELTNRLRPSPSRRLVRGRHPSVEPEAVAGELLAARRAGVAWGDMAVLVRSPRRRGRAIARALARHGIPAVPTRSGDEPVVQALVAALRWAAGDERRPDPRLVPPDELSDALRDCFREYGLAAAGFRVWERALGPALVGSDDPADDRALAAVVALLDGLERDGNLDDLAGDGDQWRANAINTDAVAIEAVAAAAGREWNTVVLAGVLEGELPAVRAHLHHFDRALLDDPVPPSIAERRRRSLADERHLFCEVATTRATTTLVATAAPEPGVLLSRFVEGWPEAEPVLPLAPGRLPSPPPDPTPGTGPVFPDGRLRLSASQLDTYDDCPLRYAYRYPLRVRDESTPQADLGTLVHDVLAAFLDPAGGRPRTREALFELAAERWRDDIARYHPQVEEARRDYFDMLERWWEQEGQGPLAPEVLAVEHPFEVEVGPHTVRGAIDRIDRADDGVGIRIVDYKTGKREPAADSIADNLQLAVYHLAARRDPALVALGEPTQLRLLYLRSMHVFEQEIAGDHEASTEARILAAADRILSEQFEPSVDADCRLCSFHRLCPIQPEGREVASA
jgi:superfamily I DNA/RNA helicase/RecB family exonuclease